MTARERLPDLSPGARRLRATEKRDAVLEFLSVSGFPAWITSMIAAKLLGLSKQGVSSTLKALARDGLLRRVPVGREAVWCLTPSGAALAAPGAMDCRLQVLDRAMIRAGEAMQIIRLIATDCRFENGRLIADECGVELFTEVPTAVKARKLVLESMAAIEAGQWRGAWWIFVIPTEIPVDRIAMRFPIPLYAEPSFHFSNFETLKKGIRP